METVIPRPSWDEFFLAIATVYSSRGTCDRLRTACVFVKNKRIVGAGYNGSVSGLTTCDESGHLIIDNHCMRTLHGEDNAKSNTISGLDGATAYIIATPCHVCVKRMLQDGIKRIVYVGTYNNGQGKDLIFDFCKEKDASLEQWTDDPEKVSAIFGKIFRRLQGDGGIFRELDLSKFLFHNNGMETGKLIIFEGGEKVGKSTQVERLAGFLLGRGYDIFVTKEPGGGMADLRQKIMVLDKKDPELAMKELALFIEDREIHYREKILLALVQKKIVICDRGPASTLAYQGYGRGLDLEEIRKQNRFATRQRCADLTILLNLPANEFLKRIARDHEAETNRFESEKPAFHKKVRRGFLAEAKLDLGHWFALDARKTKDELALEIQQEVTKKLGL